MRECLPQTINQNKGEKCNKKARTEKYFCTLSETKKDKNSVIQSKDDILYLTGKSIQQVKHAHKVMTNWPVAIFK